MNLKNLYEYNFLSEDKAFTIIELLVVTTIMGILATLAVPSLTNFVHNQREKSYIKELQ